MEKENAVQRFVRGYIESFLDSELTISSVVIQLIIKYVSMVIFTTDAVLCCRPPVDWSKHRLQPLAYDYVYWESAPADGYIEYEGKKFTPTLNTFYEAMSHPVFIIGLQSESKIAKNMKIEIKYRREVSEIKCEDCETPFKADVNGTASNYICVPIDKQLHKISDGGDVAFMPERVTYGYEGFFMRVIIENISYLC